MKRKSLMKSILVSSVGVLVAVVVVVCAVFSTMVNIRYFSVVQQDFYHTVCAESNYLSSWIDKHITIADNLAKNALAADLHGDALKTYLRDGVMNVSDSLLDCYVAWESEAPFLVAANFEPPADFVPQERGWYKQAVSAGKAILTDPYIDKSTGNIVVTIANPIIDGGKTVGMVGLDIDVSELVSIINEFKLDENGYAMLVDAADNVIVHTGSPEYTHQLDGTAEKVTALTDISAEFSEVLAAVSTGEIVHSTDYDGRKRFFPAVALGNTGWKLIYAADYFEAFGVIVFNIIVLLVLGISGMIIGSIFLTVKFKRRLRPLADIERIVSDMAEGKLEHEYPKTYANDEVGLICTELSKTNSALKTYIGEIDRRLYKMSSGDFTGSSEVDFVGEFIEIGNSLENIQSALRDTFSQIDSAAGQISDGSRGVASGATELANAVSDETSIISEVTTGIDDISQKVTKSAANALSAKDATRVTVGVVTESNDKMNELLQAMSDIAASADEIVKINETIEDIAFQTNILALNASIEAARAGAAGKGFAVVADEVRNLANKSGEASNTTRKLISETVEVIERGKELAHETAELLSDVVDRTAVIENSVSEIADVSEVQKTQLSEIVERLGAASNVVQTTAATAEESAAASEELDGQVEMLRTTLNKYKI